MALMKFKRDAHSEATDTDSEPVRQGDVVVRKEVRERIETVEVPVREEWLLIERRPGSGRVWLGERELAEGETVELPLRSERVVVRKEAVAGDDVRIEKQSRTRTERVQVPVREERLTVDGPAGAGEQQPEGPYCPLPEREGSTPATGASTGRAPAPIGYRPGGAEPASLQSEKLDEQPTERIVRAAGAETDMYDPTPTPARYGNVAPGHDATPVMPPLSDAGRIVSPQHAHADTPLNT